MKKIITLLSLLTLLASANPDTNPNDFAGRLRRAYENLPVLANDFSAVYRRAFYNVSQLRTNETAALQSILTFREKAPLATAAELAMATNEFRFKIDRLKQASQAMIDAGIQRAPWIPATFEHEMIGFQVLGNRLRLRANWKTLGAVVLAFGYQEPLPPQIPAIPGDLISTITSSDLAQFDAALLPGEQKTNLNEEFLLRAFAFENSFIFPSGPTSDKPKKKKPKGFTVTDEVRSLSASYHAALRDAFASLLVIVRSAKLDASDFEKLRAIVHGAPVAVESARVAKESAPVSAVRSEIDREIAQLNQIVRVRSEHELLCYRILSIAVSKMYDMLIPGLAFPFNRKPLEAYFITPNNGFRYTFKSGNPQSWPSLDHEVEVVANHVMILQKAFLDARDQVGKGRGPGPDPASSVVKKPATFEINGPVFLDQDSYLMVDTLVFQPDGVIYTFGHTLQITARKIIFSARTNANAATLAKKPSPLAIKPTYMAKPHIAIYNEPLSVTVGAINPKPIRLVAREIVGTPVIYGSPNLTFKERFPTHKGADVAVIFANQTHAENDTKFDIRSESGSHSKTAPSVEFANSLRSIDDIAHPFLQSWDFAVKAAEGAIKLKNLAERLRAGESEDDLASNYSEILSELKVLSDSVDPSVARPLRAVELGQTLGVLAGKNADGKSNLSGQVKIAFLNLQTWARQAQIEINLRAPEVHSEIRAGVAKLGPNLDADVLKLYTFNRVRFLRAFEGSGELSREPYDVADSIDRLYYSPTPLPSPFAVLGEKLK